VSHPAISAVFFIIADKAYLDPEQTSLGSRSRRDEIFEVQDPR
jgi:hypothetical protein